MKTFVRAMPFVAAMLLVGSSTGLSQDPAVVNAKTIRVKLENDRVRVLEAVLKPGETESLHSHPANVVYIISGGTIRNHPTNGKSSEVVLNTGDVHYRESFTHWAENIGDTTIHLILVELKNQNQK